MEKKYINKIIAIIHEQKKEDGWTNLCTLGKYLNENNINYKNWGYLKLKDFFEERDDLFELRIDSTNSVPVYFVKQRDKYSSSSSSSLKKKSNHPLQDLMKWAYMGDYSEIISNLKEFALSERWYYKLPSQKDSNPILSNYLKYTFFRLSKEDNGISYQENYAAFNTGLVNKLYEPIYAFFEKNKNQGYQKWYFKDFCIAGQGSFGKLLTSNFNPLPQRAHYFKNPSELIYDCNAPVPQLDWEHIILENIERLPPDFLAEHKPNNFNLQNPLNMETSKKEEYFKSLADAIKNDDKKFRTIKNRFEDSLKLALKRVSWNFKTAIPMYYPTKNIISLLLPLSLTDDERIDLALVVEKTNSGNYLGHTILPLAWAYSNARLITKPDSDWLAPESIVFETNIEEE